MKVQASVAKSPGLAHLYIYFVEAQIMLTINLVNREITITAELPMLGDEELFEIEISDEILPLCQKIVGGSTGAYGQLLAEFGIQLGSLMLRYTPISDIIAVQCADTGN